MKQLILRAGVTLLVVLLCACATGSTPAKVRPNGEPEVFTACNSSIIPLPGDITAVQPPRPFPSPTLTLDYARFKQFLTIETQARQCMSFAENGPHMGTGDFNILDYGGGNLGGYEHCVETMPVAPCEVTTADLEHTVWYVAEVFGEEERAAAFGRQLAAEHQAACGVSLAPRLQRPAPITMMKQCTSVRSLLLYLTLHRAQNASTGVLMAWVDPLTVRGETRCRMSNCAADLANDYWRFAICDDWRTPHRRGYEPYQPTELERFLCRGMPG